MLTPDLSSYDVILVNISAGKDSQVCLHETVMACDNLGIPRSRIVTVFCDLGDKDEWPGTRELAAEHAAHYGLRHEVVCRWITLPGGARVRQTLSEYIEQRGKWPDAARRYCTSELKRGPVEQLMTRLADEVRASWGPKRRGTCYRRVRILNVMGLRAQESPKRAAMLPFRFNKRASNQSVRLVDEWLPVHSWHLVEVLAGIKRAGTRMHPVYAKGMPRLSCRFCVLASKSALVRAAQLDPEGAQDRLGMERRMGHLFRQDLSMGQIIAEAGKAGPAEVADWAA